MKKMKILSFSILILSLVISACTPEDETKIEVNSVNPPNSAEELNNFFKAGRKALQTYSFEANQAQEIRGNAGTVLKIPANAFVHPSGQAISGTVELSLREMYNPAALIFNNAPTVANGQILSSGGSFELLVQQNGADLRLANGAQIGVEVPTDSLDPNMELFATNSRDTNNQVAWQAQNVTVIDTAIDTSGVNQRVDSLYAFQLRRLFRFINCDYFYNDPRPLTDVTIRVGPNMTFQNTRVLVYLPSINAMVPVNNFLSPDFLINGGYQMPVGINAIFIAINVDNMGNYNYAIQQNTISQNHLEVMNFQTITQAQLTQLLNNL